jgi:hypothetical protein
MPIDWFQDVPKVLMAYAVGHINWPLALSILKGSRRAQLEQFSDHIERRSSVRGMV